jgi:hypothetical protein
MNHKTLGFLCSATVLSLLSGAAQAQTSAGALQLALGTDIVTYNSSSYTVQYPGVLGRVETISSGTTRWGFSDRSGVNIEGGYGLGDSLVLGGIIGLGGWSRKTEVTEGSITANAGTDSQFDLLVAPKIDYMLFPGQAIRPFFGGAIGVQYRSVSQESPPNNNGVVNVDKDSATGLALMLRAGCRFFLTPGFSLDPAFTFLWIPTASGTHQVNNVKYDTRDIHGYTLGLTVAASGWIGL